MANIKAKTGLNLNIYIYCNDELWASSCTLYIEL